MSPEQGEGVDGREDLLEDISDNVAEVADNVLALRGSEALPEINQVSLGCWNRGE